MAKEPEKPRVTRKEDDRKQVKEARIHLLLGTPREDQLDAEKGEAGWMPAQQALPGENIRTEQYLGFY